MSRNTYITGTKHVPAHLNVWMAKLSAFPGQYRRPEQIVFSFDI